jgi:Family of unknown function (DUF6400)
MGNEALDSSPLVIDRTLMSHIHIEIDLAYDEARRRAEVAAALGPDWDPVAALRDEEAAYDLLYSGLDARQRETYAMLVSAGVLPPRGSGHAAD